MPLSEFYRLAKGKNKSAQQQHQEQDQGAAAGSGPSSSLHGADFVELVWENGQVTMKEQPNRVSKPNNGVLIDAGLPHHSSIFRDKGVANLNEDNSEMGRRGKMDSVMNDFDHISEHDDIIPWFSYNMDANEPAQHHNQSSDFFREVSGVTAAESSIHRNGFAPPSDRVLPSKGSLHSPDQRHSSFGQRDLSSARPNTSQLDRVSSFPSFRPKVSYSATHLISPVLHPSVKMQAQDLGQRVPSSSVINFPHFAAIVKPSLDAMSAKPNPEVPTTKKDNGKEKVCGGELASPSQVRAILSKSLEMSHHVSHSGNVGCQGSSRKVDVFPRQEIVTSKTVAAEPVVASSMCSANSVDGASNDPTFASKRKYNESEDSEYPSEDVEEESVDIKKAANNRLASGSKRSRIAEVHNLSERRRRDRINDKMRALQELIPNCNNVDKASMLDEAIEYLKTLQLQVQMMSMGPGVCMPPMMLPHAAHMPRFSPMGIGMGYGLSMLDMNMNSSIPRFPMVPVSQFGALNANPMPNVPMFGFQGQGIGMPMSHAPIRTAMELNTASSAQVSHSKNIVHNVVTQMHVANQVENDEPDRSATALLKDDHPLTSKAREPSAKS